jgi:hypothetical protein
MKPHQIIAMLFTWLTCAFLMIGTYFQYGFSGKLFSMFCACGLFCMVVAKIFGINQE